MKRFCKLCNYTGLRMFTDQRGRTVAGRCKCNPAPPPPPAKKQKAKAEPVQEELIETGREWFK
jgi:hypothetical protein